MNYATLIVIALCLIAVAVCVAAALQIAERKGWLSPLAIGAVVAAICVVLLAVWAVWNTFDGTSTVGAQVNGRPPTGNGNCDPACLLAYHAWQARGAG